MSSPKSAIRSAFVARLFSFPDMPQHPQGEAVNGYPEAVAWENKKFTPAVGSTYLRPRLMPGAPVQAEIGESGQNWHPGIFQVSVFAPPTDDIGTIGTLVDAIVDHFKRGLVLSYGGINLTINKAYAGPEMQETDWLHIPITIQYQALVPN